jgi:hypothetical protein
MNLFQRTIGRALALILAFALCVSSSVFAQQSAIGTLHGQVTDAFGGVIVGATITVVDANGAEKTAVTNAEGNYVVSGLAPGQYIVRAIAGGFALYENAEIEVTAGRREPLNITLTVSLDKEEVTVAAETPISLENRGDALVLRGKDIEALPDDPDELEAALQALAGPSVGPNGGQIMIDGFEGGRIPPRDSIREIRVNDNPLSAERDQPGFGGIQIFTKPGTDKLRGSVYSTFTDESMNSRNPFAERRADFQFRQYGGNLSGTIVPKVASFFIDFERSDTDDNDIVNARIIDPITLAETPFIQTVLTPARRTNFSPRVDYALNANNTLVARYNFFQVRQQNQGVSTFSLPERAFDSMFRTHTLQLTETAILSKSAINETRFQLLRGHREQTPLTDSPAIFVSEAFNRGGSQNGPAANDDSRYELTNITTIAHGTHSIKFGARLRSINVTDVSRNNFGGTFTFTSLEQFRSTVQNLPGARPTQLIIAGGNPEASIHQVDFAGFVQDDWKFRPNLTIGAGLRYETQTNISSRFNFAPRIYVSWSPDGGGQQPAKTVIRLGFGVFYDRISEQLSLRANRFNGTNQLQFRVNDPGVLDAVQFNPDGTVSNVPTVDELTGFSLPQITQRLADDITAPYSYATGLILERQLPKKFTLFSFMQLYNTRHLLRSRNINAPLPGSITPDNPRGTRPDASAGDLYQFESSGTQNLQQYTVGIRNQFSQAFSVFANYSYGRVFNDSDGPFSFPANSYDTSGEYGRAPFDVRHRVFLGGNIGVPVLKLSLNPIVILNTGRPFNITTGIDNNGDGIFNDRPAFADAQTTAADLRRTPYGDFDIRPKPGQESIPRNFAEGPGFVSFNVRISRQWGFGTVPGARAAAASNNAGGGAQPQQGGANRGGGNPRGGGGAPAGGVVQQRGGHGGGPGGHGGGPVIIGGGGPGAGSEQKRYNVTFSLFVQNLFNRANLNVPIGNLSSPFFNQSLSTLGGFGPGGSSAAGNRRLQASVRFNF